MHFDSFDKTQDRYAQYKQKGFGIIYILLGILVLVIISGGAYYLGTQRVSYLSPTAKYQQGEVRILSVTLRKNAKNLVLEDYIKQNMLLLPENKEIKFEEIKFGMLKGLYYNGATMDGRKSSEFVISKGQYVIEFSGIDNEEGRKILSTFRFD